MKIVHVVDYFHTDVGYQEYYLALHQARDGHDVTVLTTMHRHHAIADEIEGGDAGLRQLTDAGVQVMRLPSRQLGHDRAWVRGLAGTLRRLDPDAVHCHHSFSPTTVVVVLALRRHRAHLLVDNHIQEAIAPNARSRSGRLYYSAFRRVVGPFVRRRVGAWVANGPHEADFLERRLGLAPGTVEMVPLGFDEDTFHFDAARRSHVRNERGWTTDLIVTVTGKLHPGKRVEDVAAACEAVAATRPVRLVLAGTISPEYREVVATFAPEVNASGRIDVLPLLGRSELADLYLGADAVVFARLPSISIYEAAGTGARVLVGRGPFASWLSEVCPVIEQTDLPPTLAHEPGQDDDRVERARQAGTSVSWRVISRRFVGLYAAAPP